MKASNDELENVKSVIQRYKNRGNVLPKMHYSCDEDPVKQQENLDYELLRKWSNEDCRLFNQVGINLDSEMPGWRGPLYYHFLPKAQNIVSHYERKLSFAAPTIMNDWPSSREEFQEYRLLCKNKASICEDNSCPPAILAYLNREAPNWLTIGQCKEFERMDENFLKAEGIVSRYISRGRKLPKEWRHHKDNPERTQEYKDAQKLSKWKETLKRVAEGRQGKGGHNCPTQLQEYLDSNMPGWRKEVRARNIPPMQRAREIVARYKERGNIIPRQLSDRASIPDRQQEFKDAVRLKDWKRALRENKGGGGGKCDDEIRKYLDENMPGWRTRVYTKRYSGKQYGDDDGGDASDKKNENSTVNFPSDGTRIYSLDIPNSYTNMTTEALKSGTDSNMMFNFNDELTYSPYSGIKRLNEASHGDFEGLQLKKIKPVENPVTDGQWAQTNDLIVSNEQCGMMENVEILSPPRTADSLLRAHDDKEISAAVGLVAAHTPRA